MSSANLADKFVEVRVTIDVEEPTRFRLSDSSIKIVVPIHGASYSEMLQQQCTNILNSRLRLLRQGDPRIVSGNRLSNLYRTVRIIQSGEKLCYARDPVLRYGVRKVHQLVFRPDRQADSFMLELHKRLGPDSRVNGIVLMTDGRLEVV